MPIKRACNSGVGVLNRTFPFWELGGSLYWRSFKPTYVQEHGGTGTVTYTYNGMHPYYHYNPGKARFEMVSPGVFSAPVNITGVTILRINGPVGNGTLTFDVAGANHLHWTAPGDAIGAATNVGTGTYTIRSSDTSLWVVVQTVAALFPAVLKTDTITCASTNRAFPKDGFLPPERTNYFDDSMGANRGYTTIDVGLTISTPAITSTHIIDSSSSGLATTFRAANTSGGAARMSRQEALSATLSRAYSVLMKRSDGGVINAGVASLYMAALHAGAHEGTTNRYKLIRGDGWYEVFTTMPATAGPPTYAHGIQVENGFTVDIEAPGLESFGTSIWSGTNPPPYMYNSTIRSPTRAPHLLSINRKVSAGAASEPYPADGFVAATFVHPYPPAWDPAAVGLVSGTGLAWDVDANNLLRLLISNTYQTIAADMDSAGVGQVYLYSAALVPITLGLINGMVFMWGKRLNSPYALFFVNGKQIDIDTTHVMPAGDPSTIKIGYNSTSSNPLSAKIQNVLIGRSGITRSEGRALSTWMQNQAISEIA